MRGRVALRLVPLAGFAALVACVPPAPLSVSGALPPPSTSYAVIGGEDLPAPALVALAQGLAANGVSRAAAGTNPDRLVSLTLADRPRASGTVAGTAIPETRTAEGWTDRPVRDGLFSKGRREVRLTIRFLSPDGHLREERSANEVVTRKAPAADMARLITAALHP